jgi:hypothetical protein
MKRKAPDDAPLAVDKRRKLEADSASLRVRSLLDVLQSDSVSAPSVLAQALRSNMLSTQPCDFVPFARLFVQERGVPILLNHLNKPSAQSQLAVLHTLTRLCVYTSEGDGLWSALPVSSLSLSASSEQPAEVKAALEQFSQAAGLSSSSASFGSGSDVLAPSRTSGDGGAGSGPSSSAADSSAGSRAFSSASQSGAAWQPRFMTIPKAVSAALIKQGIDRTSNIARRSARLE